MSRYRLVIEYDGTNYCGWQRQKNGVSVQEKVENAIYSAFGVQTVVTGSGRTDAGVHAAAQVAHFDASLTLPPRKIREALNGYLPQDIKIVCSQAAQEGFHARFSAKQKTYQYTYYLSETERPLLSRYAARAKRPVNLAAMQTALNDILGVHDFAAFSSTGSSVKDTVREIYAATLTFTPFAQGVSGAENNAPVFHGTLTLTVTGNGFLYNMVRIIAGTLLAVGEGTLPPDVFASAFATKKRTTLGKTAPAAGLTLFSVEYPQG